ncbi:sigma-70 family RNA polymerase sigma factor [Pedobacter sp. N36a]|uniref:RNA polymerase sigma factor n=1 Tax=Pedobacter sp. N36a TaxID=2767996 RepID=UPI001656ED4B|nr:sigma-70 family RNA polymerase sigma factor [Pedobacter sp. N36a]MBC8986515.1 sigma-70 family RNA polymerase sigma factor [Pedobacter sp. N36a]
MRSIADYKDYSDAHLVDLLRADDHSAFNEMLKRYSAILINFTYRRVTDLPLAEDLVNDVWVDLWAKRSQYAYANGFEPFIFAAMRNRVLLHFRRGKISQRYIDHFKATYCEEHESSDLLVRSNELSALIEKEIAALPIKMREVFELSRKTAMSRKEIAEYLKVPENTVKTNMHRALKTLKTKLGPVMVFVFLI